MEAEHAALHGEKQSIEQQKLVLKEELIRTEQEKLDIDNEKSGQ